MDLDRGPGPGLGVMLLFRRLRRFGVLPVRYVLPSVVTLLSLCLGLTAIRHGMNGQYELAVSFVLLSCLLDGIDGRLARYLKGVTRFGAELDSLVDFACFGVVPGLLMYSWLLRDLGNFGWIAVLVYVMSMGLRLARFNVMLDGPVEAWARGYFCGVPAPLGAVILFLPLYISFVGSEGVSSSLRACGDPPISVAALYVVVVGMLLISRLPTFSAKHASVRVSRQFILPVLVLITAAVFLVFVYTWIVMVIISLVYILLLPVSGLAYLRHARCAQQRARAASGRDDGGRERKGGDFERLP